MAKDNIRDDRGTTEEAASTSHLTGHAITGGLSRLA